jgi:hypothetical protein
MVIPMPAGAGGAPPPPPPPGSGSLALEEDADDSSGNEDYAPGTDPYATGRTGNRFGRDYVYTGKENYEDMRATGGTSVCDWLTRFFGGGPKYVDQETPEFLQYWTQAVNIDTALENAYRMGGYKAVKQAFKYDPMLETSLNSLSVTHSVMLDGDTRLGEALLAVKPPGRTHVMPKRVLDAGMAASKARYQQEERVGGASLRNRRSNWFAQVAASQASSPGRGGRDRGRGGRGGRGRGGADGNNDGRAATPAGAPAPVKKK